MGVTTGMSTTTTCPCGRPSDFLCQLPNSPFESHLDTNIRPPNYDKALIEAIISDAETAIENIVAELAQTHAHLARLEDSRMSLVRFRDSHRRLLSPISSLPAELLRVIFALALNACAADRAGEDDNDSLYIPDADTSDSDSDSYTDWDTVSYDSDTRSRLQNFEDALGRRDDRDRFALSDTSSVFEYESDSEGELRDPMITTRLPWVLTHVCSTWRAVAFAFPQLWSSISMDIDITFRYFRMPAVALFERQLELAADCPLFVQFSCLRDTERARTYLDVLMRSSDRWEELDYSIDSPLLPYISNNITGSLSRLRKLTISNLEKEHTIFPNVFATAPQLREVRVLT